MKGIINVGLFLGCVVSFNARADWPMSFDRVKDVWNNVHSFQDQAWKTINDTLSSTSTDEVHQVQGKFWNNDVPNEIVDASKTAFGQLFPNLVSNVEGAWDDGKTVLENAQNLANHLGQWASQEQATASANFNALNQGASDLKTAVANYFGGNYSDGLENGGADQALVTQTGDGTISGADTLAINASTGVSPPQASSITAADLAMIGANNGNGTSTPTSLAQDAQQLPGQLVTWDQQQAALAAERARQLQIQLLQEQQQAQEYARQQRELQAAQQSVRANAANSSSEPDSPSGGGWRSLVSQGAALIQQFRLGRAAPNIRSPVNCSSPGAAANPQCAGLVGHDCTSGAGSYNCINRNGTPGNPSGTVK